MTTEIQRRSAAAKKGAATRKRMAMARGYVPNCCHCHGPRTNLFDGYCRQCRAAYMRSWRENSRETARAA